LREEFDARAPEHYERSLEVYSRRPEMFGGKQPLRPDQPGFCVTTHLISGSPQRLPNPRIGDQPRLAISWTDRIDVQRQFVRNTPPAGFLRFDIDLTQPIEPQFKAALLMAREVQRRPVKKPQRKALWLVYLRILDAKSAGATLAQMKVLLPPSKGDRTPQGVRDVLAAANDMALRFGPPFTIPAS
jgi:hypothetical protein